MSFLSRLTPRTQRLALMACLLVAFAAMLALGIDPWSSSGVTMAAHFVWKDPYVLINAVDLSDHVRQATLTYRSELQDDSAGGDNTRNRIGGLKDWTLTLEFAQDYAAGEVDATLFSIVGTSVAIEIRPTTAIVGATNPKYTGNGIIEEYQPFGGQIGALAVAPVTMQGNGDLTRATS